MGHEEPGSPMEDALYEAIRQARRIVIAVVGGSVVLIGCVMLVTPGPALVVIPAGLAILAVEFAWARRLLKRVKTEVTNRMGGKGEQKDRKSNGEPSSECPGH